MSERLWKSRVRDVYESLEELRAYDNIYNTVVRCGYDTAERLWEENPMLKGSTDPKDFGLANGL